MRAAWQDLEYVTVVGPLISGSYVSAHWVAHGTYGGGKPGASAAAGTPVRYTGTDILRTEGCKIAEVWIQQNDLEMLKQLGALDMRTDVKIADNV